MTSFENDPPSEDPIDLGDLGFNWEDGLETEVLSPQDLAILDKLTVPVSRALSSIGEITTDFQRRLGEMKVEDPRSASRHKVRRLEQLYLQKFALEDVHYHAYQAIKEKSPSPYVSLSFDDVLKYCPKDPAQVKILQNKQTFEAYGALVDLRLDQQQIYEMSTKENINGNELEKYMVRCLFRLLADRHLSEFKSKLPAQADRRGSDQRLRFEEVAGRAATIINRKYNTHLELSNNLAGIDAKMWYELERRDLERVMSFARPLMGLAPKPTK